MKLVDKCCLCIFFLALLSLYSCNKADKKFYYTSGSRHTYFRVTYEYSKALDEEIYKLFDEYYHSINPFDSTSVISKVNNNTNLDVDSIFIRAFLESQHISEITDGYFDISCSPIINYWGFGFDKNVDQKNVAIDSLLQLVGYHKIRLNGNQIVKESPQMTLNFSAIGDGYICDIIGEFFDSLGIENYMIDVGGEILAKGYNLKKENWRIGIAEPSEDPNNQEIFKTIEIEGRLGVATSGNYRNFYVKDGKKYGHTINPFTGLPVEQDILSVTVLSNSCTLSDGIATAIMTMGRKEFEKYKDKYPFIEYLIIYSDENSCQMEISEGMKQYLL